MRPINAVLVHRDPTLARALAESLQGQFRKLSVATNLSEARQAIGGLRATFVIVDLELLTYSELKKLCSDFPGTAFVCVHRLADEGMWSEALATGAVDCCQSSDLRGIRLAFERYAPAGKAIGTAA